MPVIDYPIQHKKQTKLNNCWYASIQMLKTHASGGAKAKSTGTSAEHLHGGVFGHRLHADKKNSKHFEKVLEDNGLITLPGLVARMNKPDHVYKFLDEFEPIVLGGTFGEVAFLKGFGHFIVLAGVDTDSRTYKIYDPAKKKPQWVSIDTIANKFWDDADSAFAVNT